LIVPEYWAEAKQRTHINGRQITIQRFGWSDISEADALSNAQSRVAEAIQRVETGEKVRKRDHKLSYNGAEGLPIREEIISRHGDAVITRNVYGALCLNTPDVLFADIDFAREAEFSLYIISIALIAAIAAFITLPHSWGQFLTILVVASLLLSSTLAHLLFKIKWSLSGGENHCLHVIHKVAESHPDWHLRLYKTPMGYRILVMHDTFNPRDDTTLNFLNKIHADPVYTRMCQNQNCFRARISPKPWRIGMDRLKPRPGVWPIKQIHMATRRQWVANYDKASRDYASCRFLEKIGSDLVNPRAEEIRQIHDAYCKTDSDLKLA